MIEYEEIKRLVGIIFKGVQEEYRIKPEHNPDEYWAEEEAPDPAGKFFIDDLEVDFGALKPRLEDIILKWLLNNRITVLPQHLGTE